jgi:hypothetical protein
MRGRGKGRVWMGLVGIGLVWCGAAACGHELQLPDRPTNDAPDTPSDSDGLTGAGGADDEVAPSARLPVGKEPVFTTFGGAGGEAGEGDAGGRPNQGAGGIAGKGAGGIAGKGAGGIAGKGAGGSAGGGEANAGAPGAPNGPAELLFSEYVEGSGSFKALEIYAIETSSLEGCELQTYSNGKLEPSRLALHGQLARGEVQVLCSSTLATAQPTACDRGTSLSFNGNDALALSCASQVLDVIGQIGVDPGDSWGLGATQDHTLRRRCDVLVGRRDGSTSFEIDAEWLTLGVDTFSDLGVRNCAL